MEEYDYYFLEITGVFYFPNYGGGETPAAGQLDTLQEVEAELPQFVTDVLNAPGFDATSWIGPNYAAGYFYGITQDLDYLNSVIGPGQQQVQYIEELPYGGEYAYDFVITAAQAATDNNALAAIVSNMNFTTQFDASTQEYVITGENPSLYGAGYKLFVDDDITNIAAQFNTILGNALTYGNFGAIYLQADGSGAEIGAVFQSLVLPFFALAQPQNSTSYTLTTEYGSTLTVLLQVTNDGGVIPVTADVYDQYATAPQALQHLVSSPFEISDTAAQIKSLTVDDIATFSDDNVIQINSTDAALAFSVAEASALTPNGALPVVGFIVTAPPGDDVSVNAADASDPQILSGDQINTLASEGFDTIEVSNASTLSTDQAI